MGFCINFCTNVMSGHVMSGLTLLCTDLRFGLSPASPPLQSPFCHSFSLLLDFLVPLLPQGPILRYFSLFLDFLLPPLLLKVQSATLARSFWTSSHLPSTSKSNPQLFLAPPRKKGGLQSNPPVSIHQSQSTSPILHQPIPPSKAPAISATSESGTRTYLPSCTNHFPTGLSAPELTASTANFFPATQKNIIAASIAPSGQM